MEKDGKIVRLIYVLAALVGILAYLKIDPPWVRDPPPTSSVVPQTIPISLTPREGDTTCEPTFSCSGDSLSLVENLICKTQHLCMLDHQVTSAYTNKLATKYGRAQVPFKREQYYWLKHTRNKCSTESCLMQAHNSRLAELQIER